MKHASASSSAASTEIIIHEGAVTTSRGPLWSGGNRGPHKRRGGRRVFLAGRGEAYTLHHHPPAAAVRDNTYPIQARIIEARTCLRLNYVDKRDRRMRSMAENTWTKRRLRTQWVRHSVREDRAMGPKTHPLRPTPLDSPFSSSRFFLGTTFSYKLTRTLYSGSL